MNPKVDAFIAKSTRWQAELTALRALLLAQRDLTEEVKWGQPCYTLDGANVIIIHGFKEYSALLFFKGALLDDPDNLLVRQTENVQFARQIRFTSLREITKLKPRLKAYIKQAVEVERAGLKITPKKLSDYPVPEELQQQLDKDPALKKAFQALTPGRQRAYFLNIASAKQAKTRVARVEKYIPQILAGKGMDD